VTGNDSTSGEWRYTTRSWWCTRRPRPARASAATVDASCASGWRRRSESSDDRHVRACAGDAGPRQIKPPAPSGAVTRGAIPLQRRRRW